MNNTNIAYPIKFTPILQEKIWGGNKLISDFNKKSNSNNLGESWELSGVKDFVSVVSNGELTGQTITELIRNYKQELVGAQVFEQFGYEFPLLFKFIDAKQDLSIQLHPNDKLAKERHNSFGKTEMWYVLDAEPNSKLYAGFNKKLDKNSYLEHFNNGEVLDIIHVDTVTKGDSFFIEVGTIHAIGKGIIIAEIQQTSNITYRIYDWDRVDQNGQGRELHTDLALDALDFDKVGSCKLQYQNKPNIPNNIYSCQYFTTNKISIEGITNRKTEHIDSFVVYMCVEGEGTITIDNNTENIKKGETILIPAKVQDVILKNKCNFELLEVYIDGDKK